MRTASAIASVLGGLLLAISPALAQGPGGPARGLTKSADIDDLVTRMMAFDLDKDGKLTRAEVTDARLVGLFDRADLDKDGVATKAELTALGEKEAVAAGSRGPGGPGGPGGFGPPGMGGPGGGFGRPGEVLPTMLQMRLGLSAAQRKELAELQTEVDARIAKILTDDQEATLKEIRDRGPGGPGGPGGGRGPGGPGGPGGPPPGRD